MSPDNTPLWTPPEQPQWLQRANEEGSYFDLGATIPLDEASLLAAAESGTGLSDYGDERWREPFRILLTALEEEAQLTLMGRLMARNDIVQWLRNRLQIEDCVGRHPEILEQPVAAPMFIIGLPRSGTSILFELLACDPDVGVPETWETFMPCPPPEAGTYTRDPRIERCHRLFTQWNRLVPEFATMHEMGGRIPAECGMITANTFISDHIASLHQTPSYSACCANADFLPVYEYHKKVLQVLQWKNPRQRWLLKAPEHQVHLSELLQVYPDARLVQTHRDPIKCMASTTSLLGALYLMRSNQPFNAALFEDIIMGEATSQRLLNVMRQRDDGTVPAHNIADSRFQDLMEQPVECIEGIYTHFDMDLSAAARSAIEGYLADKPRGKFGLHNYSIDEEQAGRDRSFFEAYQTRYNVPSEAV